MFELSPADREAPPEPGKLVMSYYSDVAYWSGVLPPKSAAEYAYRRTDCDIYLAEIEVTPESER